MPQATGAAGGGLDIAGLKSASSAIQAESNAASAEAMRSNMEMTKAQLQANLGMRAAKFMPQG